MEYRKLPKGTEQISVLGRGNSSLGASGHEEAVKTVAMALEHGINYFDMAAGDANPFAAFGEATAGCRDKVYYQIHFGADYTTGKYGWTLDLEKIKRSVDWQLKALKTDYIDFGFIHCIDELSDLEKAEKSGILDHIRGLKEQGRAGGPVPPVRGRGRGNLGYESVQRRPASGCEDVSVPRSADGVPVHPVCPG